MHYKDYNNALNKGYWKGKMKYSIDITNEWLGEKQKNNKVIRYKLNDEFKYKGKLYKVDGHKIVIDFKNDELLFAEILSKLTGKKIVLFPRFNTPKNFKSTDSKIGKEYIDFKITTSSSDKFIYGNITESNHQSQNYIFWIKNNLIDEDIIKYQIDNVFRRIKSINKIGVYHNGKFKMYKKIKEPLA